MIICYLLILLAILTNVTITVLLRGSDADQLFARRLGSQVRYVVWFFGPGLFTFLFFPTKLLYVPFICIILPSVIALGIRRLVVRYKFEKARRTKPRANPLDPEQATESIPEEMEEVIDEEDAPPTLRREAYEMDTRRTALAEEIGKSTQNRPRSNSYGLDASGGSSDPS